MSDGGSGRVPTEPDESRCVGQAYSQKHTMENEPMKMNQLSPALTLSRWKWKGWTVWSIAPLSFAAGALMTAGLTHVNQVRADSNRVFELRVYHSVPGKLPALES